MSDFSLLIRQWYRQNKRDLPWRNTTNPYFIWLSEIIMQQTRVDQGTSYYLKFIRNYPTVQKLAEAKEQDVLNDWQGLGYYSRARNIHFSAMQICTDYNGVFPKTYGEIIKLKGVGEYTASAISSFAYKECKAVVDGNVYRLLSRVFAIDTPIDSTIGKKQFQELANNLINCESPGEHNQAIMEVGALMCTPKNPNCNHCPIQNKCLAFESNKIHLLPVKSKKTKVKKRFFHFLIYQSNNKVILEKRNLNDIWKNMYQFPLIELTTKEGSETNSAWKNQVHESEEIKHVLSHQTIIAVFHHINLIPVKLNTNQIKVNISDVQDYPLPRLVDKYLHDSSHLF